MDKPTIKDDNFINVQHWMISKLKLTGNDLLAYAAIYGFSQDGVSTYNAGYDWLAKFLGVSKRTAIRICANLLERGLIEKRSEKDGRIVRNYFSADGCQNVISDNLSPVTKCHQGSDKMSPNNKYIINNISNSLRSLDIGVSENETLELEPTEQTQSTSSKVSDVFDFWKQTMNSPRSKLDDNRKRLIAERLKTYSVDELKAAILGCSVTPHNMGDTNGQKYNNIELILRNAGQIERFISNSENPPQKKTDDILDFYKQSVNNTCIDITPRKEEKCLPIL